MREGGEFRELMLQVFRTRMSFRRAMQRTLKRNNAGITFEMLQILSSLWHEQGITQQVLAERTAKDKACLTNLMNNLEKKGYVERIRTEADRRVVRIALTSKGRKALEQHERFYFDLVEEACRDMDDREKKIFIQSLENMSQFFSKKLLSYTESE